MIFAVLDTNVLVSALLTKNDFAATYQLIKVLSKGGFTPLYNDEIIAEYEDVLSRRKFPFTPEQIRKTINYVLQYGIDSERIRYDSTMPDEDDRVFYEVALSKEDAYLVTGNSKHFPVTPIVVTPAEMLDILSKQK